jgi:RNA recognition motif-containing protein
MEGIIRFFNTDRHFGFIDTEARQSFFFRESAVIGDPVTEGDVVMFDVEEDASSFEKYGRSKQLAINIIKLASASIEPPDDPCKLFIANLNYDASEADLEALASAYAPLESLHVVRHVDSGQSRGFGFIQTRAPAGATILIEALNGFCFHGRLLAVRYAQDRQ